MKLLLHVQLFVSMSLLQLFLWTKVLMQTAKREIGQKKRKSLESALQQMLDRGQKWSFQKPDSLPSQLHLVSCEVPATHEPLCGEEHVRHVDMRGE
mmetsp:Transcript_22076/g.30677  ORF Transcript_22076/g.30677 Transcript_22076/m.30677 type:complete len:96 (-) Transcript_22076:171-458(-)